MSRLHRVNPDDLKVKLPHNGGYEHFERVHASDAGTFDGDNDEQIIFRWTMRTKVAELRQAVMPGEGGDIG